MSDPPPDIDPRLGRSAANAAKVLQAVKSTSEREDDDRSWIARTIIWVFVGVIVAGLGVNLVEGRMTGDWTKVTIQVIDLIKSTVLPVVTLVLGYYFGRSSRG